MQPHLRQSLVHDRLHQLGLTLGSLRRDTPPRSDFQSSAVVQGIIQDLHDTR